MWNYTQANGNDLAFLGDSVWELYVRTRLLESGLTKVKDLTQQKQHFVCAEAHALVMTQLENKLTEEEHMMYQRGHNASNHSYRSTLSHQTYQASTGFEAILGYLKVSKQEERLNELCEYAYMLIKESL